MEQNIYYDSTDGIKLNGLFETVNDNNKIVLLCHGLKGNKNERNAFISLAEKLNKNGYNVFRFDFRGHGQSGGSDYEMTISKEVQDLEMTIEYLKSKGYDEFVLLGASFGASIISLLDYTKYDNIKALISWYGALDYKGTTLDLFSDENMSIAIKQGYYPIISPRTGKSFKLGIPLFEEVTKYKPYINLSKIDLPILFVHGTADMSIPYELSEKVHSMCKNSSIELIPDGTHCFDNSDDSLETAITKTIEFIKKYF